MAARKTAAQKAAEAAADVDQAEGLPLGSVWSFPASERVSIIRPDGSVVAVDPDAEGQVHHVLNLLGDYAAPGHVAVCR